MSKSRAAASSLALTRRRAWPLALLAASGACIFLPAPVTAQAVRNDLPDNAAHDPSHFAALRYRHIGPFRGGRSTTVTGIANEPFTYYMGTSGGGVFKTTDAGTSWANVSDGFIAAGSIGAVAVAPSQPEIVYVGTGSACPRGNISPGIGAFRSDDAGATWTFIGLANAGQIARVEVHPSNPDLVYVAALGHIFGPNEERGVFRSEDGGRNWEKVLYLSAETGAVDIKLDADNPDVLYAAFWHAERKPWTIVSGGTEGGIYKSTDGGNHWSKLTDGLPQGMTGRIGLAVSPANPARIWAIIEGERKVSGFERDESGLYRSDNGGRTWQLINADPELHQRPWYYHHLVADPKDANTLYHVGDSLWKSTDGGENFTTIEAPHVDHHDLWINPHDTRLMIEANDGGGAVTLNGGATWSSQLNQPTAELYRVSVDQDFPYRVYSGQQDYSTISLPSQALGAGGITLQHWSVVGGGEMGPVAVDPRDADIAYAGGYLSRMNRKSGQIRRIMDYPQYWSGVPAGKLRYRVPSNAPIKVSAHDPEIVYTTSQFVHRSQNGGQSWELISPDLTRNDPDKIVISGGPLTRDLTSVETYCTIFSLEESPLTPGELWTGSDDGLVHLSRDGGADWRNVTPAGMPEWGRVGSIDLSQHTPGHAIVSVTRYMFDDFRPYIFSTDDYGNSWRSIASDNGLPASHFVRVAREDPGRPGLIYAGTEFGLFVSFDDGGAWQPLQLNLPITPISDLLVQRNDLVVGTQGRGFWILDDVTPLHQVENLAETNSAFLFKPRDTYRVEGGWRQPGAYVSQDDFMGGIIETDRIGENPPPGAMIFYYLPPIDGPAPAVRLQILDDVGSEVRAWSSGSDTKLSTEPGMHRWVWDLTYPGADIIPGSRLDGYTGGPRAVPGNYRVRLQVGAMSQAEDLVLLPDPRSAASHDDLQAQFELLLKLRDRITETHDAVRTMHAVGEEVDSALERIAATTTTSAQQAGERTALLGRLRAQGAGIRTGFEALEDRLRQKRARVWQDTANFEPLLDDQFAWLASYTLSADTRPTDSAQLRYADLLQELTAVLAQLEKFMSEDVTSFRNAVQAWEDR